MPGFRFTLTHEILGSIEISEPDGWKGSKIILERDKDFFSIVEYYEGGAGGAFIFYGNNGTENGGIDFIRQVEETYGFDAIIEVTVEYSANGLTYETLFTGQLDISAKTEMPDNRMQVPIIRDDFWSKFINRFDTPVSISSTTDLDGNSVDAVTPIDILLTPQKLRQTFSADYTDDDGIDGVREYNIPGNQYGIIDFENPLIDEISERFTYLNVDDPEIPFELFALKYAGSYRFQITINASTTPFSVLGSQVANLQVRFQINNDAPITVTKTSSGVDGINGASNFSYDATHNLSVNDQVRIYFENTSASTNTFFVSGKTFSYITVTADTIYPATQAQGYLIHDLFHAVIARIGLGTDAFYSEYLGGSQTNSVQYADEGCFWNLAIIKGLQLRQYTITEKPFFISLKQLWDGINPILNLGLGYEEIDGVQKIRVEEKGHFLEDEASIDIPNVRDIEISYDKEMIFKTISAGFRKWESENASGIDDPQTKHTYATRFLKTGREVNIESDFIAASLASETARRTVKEKTADYKFDNSNFILSLARAGTSPSLFEPELDENFTSISNLLGKETRYNLILTPKRSLMRWANYFNGCLQSYTGSAYKFVSGEGNYTLITDHDCVVSGLECQAVLCGPIAESGDLTVSEISDYYFLPLHPKITVPMSYDDFKVIRDERKKGLNISQTNADFILLKLDKLEYDFIKGEATITAWSKTFFSVQNIQEVTAMSGCAVRASDGGGTVSPGIETCYRITENGLTRITEDGNNRIPENC
jgi:hypothetical protein